MPEQASREWRLLNQDGTFNIAFAERTSAGWSKDVYHQLLVMSWPAWIGMVAAAYVVANIFFALGYWACGLAPRFLDCFFFSVDTIATLGSGLITPHGDLSQALMAVESFTGLFGIAIVTGLVFARFSRPTARVVFSRVAVLSEHDGVPSLIFRMENLRANQIVESQVSVILTREERTKEGEVYRNFHDLKLETRRNPIFVLTWTVVHPIDSSSPLHGMTAQDLIDQKVEILVVVTGWDETFAQTIHSRHSYLPEEILWDRRFVDMLERHPSGKLTLVHSHRIHDVTPV